MTFRTWQEIARRRALRCLRMVDIDFAVHRLLSFCVDNRRRATSFSAGGQGEEANRAPPRDHAEVVCQRRHAPDQLLEVR